jgi:hypothetical protein
MDELSKSLTGQPFTLHNLSGALLFDREEVSEIDFAYNQEKSVNIIGVLKKPKGLVSYKVSVHIRGTDKHGKETRRMMVAEGMRDEDKALLK